MAGKKPKRLQKVAKEFNVGISTIIDYLASKDIEIPNNPNHKLEQEAYEVLLEKFQPDKLAKEKSDKVVLPGKQKTRKKEEEEKEEILIKTNTGPSKKEEEEPEEPKESKKEEKDSEKTEEVKKEKKKGGLKVLGKIDLSDKKEEPVEKEKEKTEESKTPSEEKEKAEEEKPEATEEKEEPVEEEKEEVGEVKAAKPEEEKHQEKEEKEKAHVEAEKKEEKPSSKEKEETETASKEETEKEEEKESKEATEDSDSEESKEKAEEPKSEDKPKSKEDERDLKGLKVVGKIDLKDIKSDKKKKKKKQPVASTADPSTMRKKRRKRKRIGGEEPKGGGDKAPQKGAKRKRAKKKEPEEIDEKQIQDQIKATLNKLSKKQQGGSSSRSKMRKKKRDEVREKEAERQLQEEEDSKIIKVTEFITVNELANVMDVSVTEVITACMNLGMMVSINQRIDAETITVLADEFGYDVEFREATVDEPSLEEEDDEDRMGERAPIVTIMGHVDHGKTSLLDYIRKSNIIAGESGGITQHIGAYKVQREDGSSITFLDTPGHEAFTAMRARGAKVTDVAIIVIAADDNVMPQTKEAISHAQAAGVPIVFAFNKVDKETANPDRLREELSEMNVLVEEWGGKYQTQEISAKKGTNIDDLLEKVLLESELLELKADPVKRAVGTVVEASLDKGKGIVTNVLIQKGILRMGDPILAGANYGRVKAMFDERGHKINEAGPSDPVQLLGFDGAPQAGDTFYVTEEESLAKEIATERKQLIREQGIRATKHITLDEIGRRLAVGNFQELNLIIKGDVDGSVEAMSDSFQKLSTEEIQVNVIHKAVGQISESDVMLASASDAIIIGFQVRPSMNARKIAETEQIDIRLYSVIYDAIEELKAAMEGMLAPKYEEKIVGNVEIRETFKITKVGTIAGCMVLDGKVNRNNQIRLIREGVVIYTGELASLKRFKDDVKEVAAGYECGLNIKNYNDIKEGDVIEVFEEVEVERKL